MNRNFSNLNHYLNLLMDDDYGQPTDAGHTALIAEIDAKWIGNMSTCKSVLDVGCGAGPAAEPYFRDRGIKYTGVSLGKDVDLAVKNIKGDSSVQKADMTFMDMFPDESFDLIYCRHTLEHSAMPLLTLFEFHRVAKSWLCVIVPTPKYYGRTGLNHYSVLYPDQWEFLMDRAGWHVMWTDFSNETEFRFMCEKKKQEVYDPAEPFGK